jgi:H+/Cl- antiporter ClcA
MIKILGSIRDRLKHSFDRIRNEKVKNNILQALPFWIASLLAGLVAVFYAKLFALAEKGTAYILHYNQALFFIITPVCFVLGWLVVLKFAPYARGSGIPQVMAAIELATPRYIDKVKKLLSIRVIVVKFISSLIMIFGGAVIGREGPTIQIVSSVFRKINLWLPDWWPKISKKNMIMTGAAAGLAAAFNTPLGGIVFAVEELTKTHINYFKTALFTAIIIAGLTAQAFLGPYLYLGYPDVSNLAPSVFLVLIIVAIIAGLGGSGMARVIMMISRWKAAKFKKWYHHVVFLVVCALILVSLMYFVNVKMFGSGKNLMTQTLFTPDKYSEWDVPILRILGPVLSFTSGASGGIFAPSLSAGAGIGSWLAGVFSLPVPATNLVILGGMVAFLTGVTRSPFTSAILVLEMTDRHNVIFHLMLAGMIGSVVSLLIDRHSLYDRLRDQYMHELHHEDDIHAPLNNTESTPDDGVDSGENTVKEKKQSTDDREKPGEN